MALLDENDLAPAFSIPNQDGNPTSLEQFQGKNVVLWWYPKADTPGCTIEGKGFRDRSEEFDAKNAVIVGVSCDSPEANAAFKTKFGFPYDLLCDTDRSMSVAYGAADSPDAERAARISYLIGPDGRIKKVYGNVTPADHPAEVLADLN